MITEDKAEDSGKSPKITVTILTYNRAKLLPRAIKSVLNQTFSDFELIIINNAATDNTEEVIKSFKDKRIIYAKHEKNIPPSAGLNTGIDLAKGKYLVNLSDDDELLPNALEIVAEKFAELSPKGVKMIWFDCINAETGEYSGSGIRKEGPIFFKDYLCDRFSGDYQIATDKDIIGDNRFNPDFWGGMPSSLWLKFYRNNKTFYIPETICKMYREHGDSRISKGETSLLLNHTTRIILTLKFFLREYGEEMKAFCPKCYGKKLAQLGFYQILNGEKQEGRSNIITSFKLNFSLVYYFVLISSYILNKNQIKFISLSFLKVRKAINHVRT